MSNYNWDVGDVFDFILRMEPTLGEICEEFKLSRGLMRKMLTGWGCYQKGSFWYLPDWH
ncbi:MAG: hypothetical protein WBA77_11840 [Microcoleaceae cyanobacterium]